MEKPDSYRQFCPVAMASEVFCTRWTPLILRELLSGTTRFNDIRRGLPRISPTLLSKRLKQLEAAGIITHMGSKGEESAEYRLTEAGQDMKAIVFNLGLWGHRWIDTSRSLRNLDACFLMWDMRRCLNPTPIPRGRQVIQFVYPEQKPGNRHWWLIVEDGKTDLCKIDPGFDVDLYVSTDLRTMTAIWMGYTTVEDEARGGRLRLTGDETLRTAMPRWLGLSIFAAHEKRVP